MTIRLHNYIYTMKMWESVLEDFKSSPNIIAGTNTKDGESFQVYWGSLEIPGAKSVVLETGFFKDASHLDTSGLYSHSALCTPQALRLIDSFCAKKSARMILGENADYLSSKYPQGEDKAIKKEEIRWDSIVLALQNPGDRSIRAVTSPEKYYEFIEHACKFYGTKLFIKLHPWNSGLTGERIREIAGKYNVRAAKIGHRIIEHCEFVLVFNSTYAVDCMLRNVPVAQYAPGYFYQNPAVQYTEFTFPTTVKTDVTFGQKTCDFLMWKYCFDHTMSSEKWIAMFEYFAASTNMFPMPEEYCYAVGK